MSVPKEEFKFPDEVSIEASTEVEIVDDTPLEDRGRTPLPKEIVEEIENDPLDDVSDKVKTRINQLRKVYHDERREKESAKREREEALAFAQRAFEENKQLKQRLGDGEKVFISEVTKSATTEVTAAKDALRRAIDSGDTNSIAEAQEALTDAKIKLREYQNYRPSLQEEESRVQQTPQAQAAPKPVVDPKAEIWRQNNTWFGSDPEMTASALGLHEKLVNSGVDPRSDDYYATVDKTMRRRFPEYYEDATPTNEARDDRPAPRKNNTVVASATRSTAPRQVRLTASQASIAKRLGLTPEAYAREMVKLENNNG
jgi:hypothetical protein